MSRCDFHPSLRGEDATTTARGDLYVERCMTTSVRRGQVNTSTPATATSPRSADRRCFNFGAYLDARMWDSTPHFLNLRQLVDVQFITASAVQRPWT